MDKKLLYRFLKCEVSPGEEKTVYEWISASEKNKAEYFRLKEIYNIIALHAPGAGEPARFSYLSGKKKIIRFIAGTAALLAVMAGGWVGGQSVLRSGYQEKYVRIEVPTGQRMNITLADGTNVWLNTGTAIDYPVVFGRERRVKIDGEALLDVAHNAGKPFVVETYACDLEVLGTKFNVSAYKDQGMFATALIEGSVKVSDKISGGQEIILHPGQLISLDRSRYILGEFDTDDDFSWTERIIRMDNLSLEELAKELERYFGFSISIERSVMPRFGRGRIRVENGLEYALKVMEMASGFSYEIDEENRRVIIR